MIIQKGRSRNDTIRADIFSLVIIVVIMLALIVVIKFISILNQKVITELKSDPDLNDTSTKSGQTLQMLDGKPILWADMWLVFTFFGWLIALIIAGLYTDFTPATMIIFFLLLLLVVWLQMQAANFYGALDDQAAIHQGGFSFSMSNAVFKEALPIITLIVGIVVMIILYARRSQENF